MPFIDEKLALQHAGRVLELKGLQHLLERIEPHHVERLEQDLQAVVDHHTAQLALPRWVNADSQLAHS